MQTQMTGVEVTGQNLANVNTTGYSRQRVQIAASPDMMTSIGPEGTGADATSHPANRQQPAQQPDPVAGQHERLLEFAADGAAKRAKRPQ